MHIIIHRGTHEIGGTCIGFSSRDSRILLDIGMPLVQPDGTEFQMRNYKKLSGPELKARGILPPVEGLYGWETPSVDGVLISHAHQDHYGFLNHVHPDIPVYVSEGTQKLIEITATFMNRKSPLHKPVVFGWPACFQAGAFTVTPHLVDHSGFGAFAFEIEAEGKRVFYSGDFREHGPLGKSLDILYDKVRPGVDALLMEGTMLGRTGEPVMTEAELSNKAEAICRQTDKAVLIYQSGQNISRAVSFYKAAKHTGRLFVLDVYAAHVLSELSTLDGGNKLPYPGKPGFEEVCVWYPWFLTDKLFNRNLAHIPYRHRPHKTTKEDIAANPGKVMFFVRPGMESDLERIPGLEGSTLIYSLWEGYKEQERTQNFLRAVESLGINVVSLHTSGHADLPALQRMANALQPKQIIPIHTFHPEDYETHFPFPIACAPDGRYEL